MSSLTVPRLTRMSRCPITSQMTSTGLFPRSLVGPEAPCDVEGRARTVGDEVADPVEAVGMEREPLGDQRPVVGDRRSVPAGIAGAELHHLGLAKVAPGTRAAPGAARHPEAPSA